MEKYVTLIGYEQVQSAAHTMRSAADEMRNAASTISTALSAFTYDMRQLVERLERLKESQDANRS